MTKAICSVTLALVALPGLCSGSELKVMLRPEAAVQPSQVVTVGDIASVQGPQSLVTKAEQVSVAFAPPPGDKRVVKSDYVKLRLAAAELSERVTVTGSKTTTLTGKCRSWSADSIADAAKQFIKSQLPEENRTYEIDVERQPRALTTAPGGSAELRTRLAGSALRNGINTIVVEAVVDGRVVAASSVVVDVREVAEVLTSLEPIRQGEPLTEHNTAWATRDVSRVTAPVRASDKPMDLVARRSIPAGALITSADATTPPVVKRGDTVSLIVRFGRVRLVTTAEAREDGRGGELISVRPACSRQDVRGRLVEPGLVEIAG